jgi:hypothetical protein
MDEHARLDETRGGAWLTPSEARRHDFLTTTSGGLIDKVDAAAVFGAGGGGVAAYLRHVSHVASLTLVEDDASGLIALRNTYTGARGVTIVEADPVEALDDVIRQRQPSVVILDLRGREVEPPVVRVLAQPLDRVEVLWVIYGPETDSERAAGLDEMIRTWHSDELRWYLQSVKHNDEIGSLLVYARE